MIRRRFEWKVRDRAITLGEHTLVMGVLNVTSDSFSDGGRYDDPDVAVRRALEMQDEGADLIDIGAESTRPGSERISEGEEIRRLIPVLKRLKGKLDIPISVDTYKPGVAQAALDHGIQIINDVSGLTWEPALAKVVRDSDAGLVINHMRGTPETWARLAPMRNVLAEIAADLEASVHRARDAGVELNRIVIDPGIGFGKRMEQNYELLARLRELERLNLPILAGPSRKSFLTQKDPIATEHATSAAVAIAILNGAYIVRVHNVAAMKAAVKVADAFIGAIPEPREEEEERKPGRQLRPVDLDLREKQPSKPLRPPVKRVERHEPPRPPMKRAERQDTPPREEAPPHRDAAPRGGEVRRPPRRDFQPRGGEQQRGGPPRREFPPRKPGFAPRRPGGGSGHPGSSGGSGRPGSGGDRRPPGGGRPGGSRPPGGPPRGPRGPKTPGRRG
jgi:dihydropteroate synthase